MSKRKALVADSPVQQPVSSSDRAAHLVNAAGKVKVTPVRSGSAKRDELLGILRNKRKARAALMRLELVEAEGLLPLLQAVISTKHQENRAAQAEQERKIAAVREVMQQLHSAGVEDNELSQLMVKARRS